MHDDHRQYIASDLYIYIYIVFDLYCNLLMAWTNIVSCKAVLVAQWSLLQLDRARSKQLIYSLLL
jgi:hypothetical protein